MHTTEERCNDTFELYTNQMIPYSTAFPHEKYKGCEKKNVEARLKI